MKNKFEALKAFQSWPRDWQELCAEFWAESDTTFEARLDARQSEVNPVGLVLPAIGDPFPHDGPKIAFGCIDQGEMKLRAEPVRRAVKTQPMKPWSMADDEALVKLHDSGIRRSQIIMRFMADHPYRTFNAVASRHDHLRRLDWKVQ